MKKVIINADDFGLSKSINKGIIRAYKEGVLTSVSLMVNMPGFEDAVNLIKTNPGLGAGLHINIFRGKPILSYDKTKTLTDKNGFFLQSIFKIVKRIYQKRISLTELELECGAQIKKALDEGINITHLDSEKHLHLFGCIYGIIVRLGRKYGIYKIRNINEYPYLIKPILKQRYILSSALFKTTLLQLLSNRRKKINSTNSIKKADYSFGLLETGNMTADKYEKLFFCLKDGVTEIFCHPGYIDEEWLCPPLNREKYRINAHREGELNALLSSRLREVIYKRGIELINYKDI